MIIIRHKERTGTMKKGKKEKNAAAEKSVKKEPYVPAAAEETLEEDGITLATFITAYPQEPFPAPVASALETYAGTYRDGIKNQLFPAIADAYRKDEDEKKKLHFRTYIFRLNIAAAHTDGGFCAFTVAFSMFRRAKRLFCTETALTLGKNGRRIPPTDFLPKEECTAVKKKFGNFSGFLPERDRVLFYFDEAKRPVSVKIPSPDETEKKEETKKEKSGSKKTNKSE